jgi:predicted transcriptional regulator
MFKKVKNIKERNSTIVQSYKKGYSQQMIATVLDITQQAVFAVIKRSRG